MRAYLRVLLVLLVAAGAEAQPCSDACPAWVPRQGGCCPAQPITPQTRGLLTVRSNRPDARWRLDDSAQPMPLGEHAVAAGVYRLSVDAPGVLPLSWQVLVRPGEALSFFVRLCEAGQAPSLAQLLEPGQAPPERSCGPRPACLPGQRFDAELDRCAGTPTACPAGQVPVFDRCLPPASKSDSDNDGVPDSLDDCWDRAEDRDGFQDDDGCPDPDNDRDGIPDTADRCPLQPEDRDGFQDQDGCPDPDNDGDGLADAVDKCPNAAEDFDRYQDDDGCPDLDDDEDGVPDARDRCPHSAETMNGYQDDDGCPDRVPVMLDFILERPLTARYGLGITTVSPVFTPQPGVTVSAVVGTWLGLEAGVEGSWPVPGQTGGVGSFLLGAAPFRFGFWLGDYGGTAFVLAEPFVRVAISPGRWIPGIIIGNRFSFRGQTEWSLVVAVETGRADLTTGFRVGLEIEPALASRGSFFRRGFSVEASAALGIAPTKDGPIPQISGLFDLVAAFQGLGVGLTVSTFNFAIPFIEVAPIRFGTTDDADQWLFSFEPIARFAWYRYDVGTGTFLGGRLGVTATPLPGHPTFTIRMGCELGPGNTNVFFSTAFGLRWEMNR